MMNTNNLISTFEMTRYFFNLSFLVVGSIVVISSSASLLSNCRFPCFFCARNALPFLSSCIIMKMTNMIIASSIVILYFEDRAISNDYVALAKSLFSADPISNI